MTALQQKMPFGEQLVSRGLLMDVQLQLAQREQQRSGGSLARILVQLGFITPETLAEFLGRQAGSSAINLNSTAIDRNVLELVPLDVARRCVGMPVSRRNGTLTVALADPFDVNAVDTLRQVTGLGIDIVTAPERDILNCLELYYTHGDTLGESIDKVLEEKDRQKVQSLDEVLNRMANKDEDAPVICAVRQIITRA